MVKVICGWCREEFDIGNAERGAYGYGHHFCPHCARSVRSSKKEIIEEPGIKRHVHIDLKKGDVV